MSTALPPTWQRVFKTPFRELVSEGPTGSLDWRVTLVNANAPAPIADVIGKVVRRSRLWDAEKQAVTGELLAHFGDGLEAGATAEELVESFGDPAVAGRLIRRAKVRCRSVGWHAWWWVVHGGSAVAIAYVALGFYLMSQRPQVNTDAVQATINGPIHSRPEAEKAWPDYAQLLRQLEKERDGNVPSTAWVVTIGGLMGELEGYAAAYSLGKSHQTAEQRAALDKWLAEHAEWLAEFREAALKPSLGLGIGPSNDFPAEAAAAWGYTLPSDDEDLWRGSFHSSLLPQHELVGFARWLLADAELARRQGDGDRLLANLRSAIGLSRQAREPSLMVTTWRADSILTMSIGVVKSTLAESPELWSTKQLRDLAHTLATIDRSPQHWLAGEEAGCRDFIDRLFAGERLSFGGVRTYGNDLELGDRAVAAVRISQPTREGGEIRSWLRTPIENVVFKVQAAVFMPLIVTKVTKSEALRDADLLLCLARERANTPLWEDPPSIDQAIKVLPSARRELAERWLSDFRIDRGWRLAGSLDGALIGIALELARREADGQWPETLEVLAPRFLPELPIDLINGGPLGYRLVEGKPVVYSLGVDRNDDGGKLPAACDPGRTRNEGYRWDEYRPGPPLNREMTEDSAFWEDGDWVLWSLAGPRYMPDAKAQPVGDSE